VLAAERRQYGGGHRLHPKRQTVHAGVSIAAQLGCIDGFGVALDGHLRSGVPRDRSQDQAQPVGVEQRGVPPPKNTDDAGLIPPPTARRTSTWQAAT